MHLYYLDKKKITFNSNSVLSRVYPSNPTNCQMRLCLTCSHKYFIPRRKTTTTREDVKPRVNNSLSKNLPQKSLCHICAPCCFVPQPCGFLFQHSKVLRLHDGGTKHDCHRQSLPKPQRREVSFGSANRDSRGRRHKLSEERQRSKDADCLILFTSLTPKKGKRKRFNNSNETVLRAREEGRGCSNLRLSCILFLPLWIIKTKAVGSSLYSQDGRRKEKTARNKEDALNISLMRCFLENIFHQSNCVTNERYCC